jgi:DNA-binding Xre family transcriptional regulator
LADITFMTNSTPDTAPPNVVASRIKQRLADLKKNPSSVALEAGLGRSSVRDIVVGKAQNPRLDTLKKLTIPLECSLQYLTGASDVPGLPMRWLQSSDPFTAINQMSLADQAVILEIGVFRTPRFDLAGEALETTRPLEYKRMILGDNRFPGWEVKLYTIEDNSLANRNIAKGDFFLGAQPPQNRIIPIVPGGIVIVRHTIGTNDAQELSARLVTVIDGNIALASDSDTAFDPLILRDPEVTVADEVDKIESATPNFYLTETGSIKIEGIIVQMFRDLP